MPSSHICGQHLPIFLVKYVPDKWRSIQQGKLPSSLKLDDLVSSSWLDPDWHRNNTANQKLDNISKWEEDKKVLNFQHNSFICKKLFLKVKVLQHYNCVNMINLHKIIVRSPRAILKGFMNVMKAKMMTAESA